MIDVIAGFFVIGAILIFAMYILFAMNTNGLIFTDEVLSELDMTLTDIGIIIWMIVFFAFLIIVLVRVYKGR